MSDRNQRIEVFNDTQDWIKNDPTLSASIPLAKKNTTVFYEDDYPAFDSSKIKDTVITVSVDRSYQAAMKLKDTYPIEGEVTAELKLLDFIKSRKEIALQN